VKNNILELIFYNIGRIVRKFLVGKHYSKTTLRSMTTNHLPSTSVSWRHASGFEFYMGENYPACLRNIGGSTQVPVCAWNNVQRGTLGLSPPVHLEICPLTYIVSVQCVKPNQNIFLICWNKKGLSFTTRIEPG
jgi:hypothetical protein